MLDSLSNRTDASYTLVRAPVSPSPESFIESRQIAFSTDTASLRQFYEHYSQTMTYSPILSAHYGLSVGSFECTFKR